MVQESQLLENLRLIPGYNPWDLAGDAWLDLAAAQNAIDFFHECLKHVEGDARGQPFILEPWQQAIVGNLHGWKRKDERGRIVRRYRKFLLYVPRGNGKSPLCSGLCVYGLSCDNEPGAQIYLAAGQYHQAGILFRNARGMVDQEPELSARIKVYGGDNNKCLVLRDDPLSFCKVIPAEAQGQHGGIPHMAIIDELHVQESRDLVDVFETGMAKKVRAQPMLGMVTTADFDRPSICNEVHAYAKTVRDNHGDPERAGFDSAFLPAIYEVEPEEDWHSEAVWTRANPNMGVSVSLESIRGLHKKAVENPVFENTFKRLHLDMKTNQDVRVVPMYAWDKGDVAIDLDELKGRPCYGGLDIASSEDLASFCLAFPFPNEIVKVLVWSWCPEERFKDRVRAGKAPWEIWNSRGWLAVTPGNQIDFPTIQKHVEEHAKIYDLKELGIDGWNSKQMQQNLDQAGIAVVELFPCYRNLSGPFKESMRRIKAGKLIHGGNQLLRWAASNVAPQYDGRIPDGVKLEDYLEKVPMMPSKKKSAEKIDPFTAMVLAFNRLVAHPEQEKKSVYASRGLLVLT